MPSRGVTPTATRAVVAQRRTEAIELRHAGVDPVTIGRRLKYGRWSADGTEQLSSDASLARMVRQDISRGLADRREGLDRAAAEMKLQMTERLERLRAGVWAKAVNSSNPHIGAVREARAIDAQLAQLWGLNAPVRLTGDFEHSSAQVEAAVTELFSLIRQPAEGAPLPPALEA